MDTNYDNLCESVRYRPGLFFGSVGLNGLHIAIMDIVFFCLENQKNDIQITVNGSDITISHDGEMLASNVNTDIVKYACDSFSYENNEYQFRLDREIFKITEPNYDVLFDSLRELAYLNKSLKINLNGHHFFYENGLMIFINTLGLGRDFIGL